MLIKDRFIKKLDINGKLKKNNNGRFYKNKAYRDTPIHLVLSTSSSFFLGRLIQMSPKGRGIQCQV